jgi:hypothetical protein
VGYAWGTECAGYKLLQPTLLSIIVKYSVLTSKKTQIPIIKTDLLSLFKDITAVYSENRTKTVKVLTAKAGGTYSYHWTVKG